MLLKLNSLIVCRKTNIEFFSSGNSTLDEIMMNLMHSVEVFKELMETDIAEEVRNVSFNWQCGAVVNFLLSKRSPHLFAFSWENEAAL